MAWISNLMQTPASVTTPGSGYLSLFANSATGAWASKNSSGQVATISGGGPVQWVNAVNVIGLDNTGVNDNAATLNTYLAANNAQVIYFPAGTYKFTTTITVANSFIFLGDGINATNIETTSATADIFQMTTNWYNAFEQLNFKSTVTRTAGYAINFQTTDYGFVNNCQFQSMFNAINLGGNLNYVTNCFFASTISVGIAVSGAANNSYVAFCTWTAQGSIPAGSAGISVTQCGSLLLSDCDIISMASGLLLSPTSPNGIFSVQANNCFFDTCITGVSVTGTGNVQRCLFGDCWFGDSTNGFASTNTATTPPAGFMFTGCFFMNNSANGMLCTDMSDFNAIGCTFGGNTTSGITVSAAGTAATRFTIAGCNIGTMGGVGGATTGILVNSGTYGSYLIQGNTITGNTMAISDGGSVTGQNQKVIKDNIGCLFTGAISTTTAASSALNTTETIVAGGLNNAVIPANSLKVGSIVRATMIGTCTSTAANASTFTLRMGTAGTTADASVGTAAVTAATSGTSIAFKAVLEFVVVTTGSTGTILGNLTINNTGITGIATNNVTVVPMTVTATLNTTTANYIEVTYKSAATTTTSTFSAPCYVEVIKP